MQPAWSRWTRAGMRAPETPEAPERAAGIVAPRALSERPTLPRQADFAGSRWGDAFWAFGDPASPILQLYVSSGARLVADLRQELGLAPSPAMWTPAVLEALKSRAGLGDSWRVPSTGDVLRRDWLAVGIWWAYGRDAWPRNLDWIRFPGLAIFPRVGQDLGTSAGGATSVFANLDPAELTLNPFGPIQGPEIDVTGTPPAPTASSPSSGMGGLGLALLALAAVTLND